MESTSNQLGSPGNMFAHDNPSLEQTESKKNVDFLSLKPLDMFKIMSTLSSQNPHDQGAVSTSGRFPQKLRGLDVGSWGPVKASIPNGSETPINVAPTRARDSGLETGINDIFTNTQNNMVLSLEYCDRTLSRINSHEEGNLKTGNSKRSPQPSSKGSFLAPNTIGPSIIPTSGLNLPPGQDIERSYTSQNEVGGPISSFDTVSTSGFYVIPKTPVIMSPHPQRSNYFAEKALSSDLHLEINQKENQILVQASQQRGPGLTFNQKETAPTSLSVSKRRPGTKAFLRRTSAPARELIDSELGCGSDGEKSISSRVGSPVLGSAGYSFVVESRFAAIAQKGSKGSNNGAVIPKDTATETPNQDRSKLSHDSSPKEILQEQQPTEHLIQPRELPNIGINDNLHFKNHLGIEEGPLISMSTTASGSGFGEPLGFKEAPGQPILDSLDIVDEDSNHTSSEGDKNENEENVEIQALGNLKGVVLVSHKPYTKRITARRRARQGEFSKWCEEKSKEIQIEAIVERHQQDEEKMSARAMITSHKFIISDPREYQMELFEVAKERNTIAVLDTGSGKTLIACLLIRHMVDQELESRMLGRHRRVSFFLVDCVTLVFQQAAVLNCNIDAKIGKYCGNMGVDLWKKDIWDKILDDEQVIVMTADVLYNCLTHAFIKMEDINLLCFDEAHHAKKKHVYARIIKDFYICEPEDKRPKIFGMTASPVDARVDVVQAALELEELLHSKITTASDLMLLQSSVNRPKEEVAAYSKLQAPFQTQLCSKLHSKYGEYESFGKIFAFSKQCASELGPWCADQVWKFALSEQEYRKLKRKEERNANRQSSQNGLDLIEKDIQLLREAKVDVQNHIFDTPDPETSDLSSKVVLLHRFLRHVYAEENNNKCIIFVSRRYTARVLAALLKEVGSEYMKLGILIGSSSSGAGDENVTFRQQMVTVSQFRRGKLNCLIATSVAEEGLDIPDCSLIIRFDLYTTMIQYIQSRGRARHSKSRYIHMLEAGNGEHRRILGDVRSAEGIMRTFCQSLPEDRLLNEPPSSEHLVDENDRIYIEPESGAKLTFSSAMQIMGHYLGSLPHDGEDLSPPIYKVRRLGERSYICELLLPAGSPITCVGGTAMTTKSGAKRAAAFEACLQLRAKEHLNAHLLPKYRRRDIPKMANAHLALDSSKTQNYASKEKPTFWTIKDSTPPSQAWITVFLLSNQHEINERLLPIAIATREKLPNIPSFPIHSDRGALSDVISLRLNKPLDLTVEKLELLSRFTIRLFHDLFNKLFEQDDSTFPYWIAPCKSGEWNEKTLADDVLDWEMMTCIMSSAQLEWDDKTPIHNFVDRFLVDRRQRSRRFIVYDCDPTLSPKDPVPMQMSHGSPISSILDYSYNAGKKGPWKYIKWKIPETEPVLVADRLLHRLNYLDPPSEKDANTCTEAWICPSAFQVSMIPCHVIHMAMIFPSISTRIDAYLHAWDVCKLLGVEDLDLRLALEAITKDSDNSHEHNKNQVNPRKGMGNNYERLEFLGDCFLKVASSISLFAENHENDEYQLHVKRMLLVCNQHLFEKAKRINLPTYIQTEGFSRRWWYPATMKQILEKGTGKKIGKPGGLHRLADKSISDVCEALIGAALIDKGLDGATQMVTAILQTPEHLQKEWADYYKGYIKPGYQTALPSASQIKLATDIEKQIGYKFQSPKLLVSAFTHSSNPYSWEKVPCYQRLEFLGDSLLDLVCVRYIFNKYPEADPQWLTEHKMAMVSNKFLGAVSVVMGFHRKLKRVGQHLDIAIRDYAIEITEAKEKSNGAVDFWTSVSPPPKALPDILEAFIGALFVDSEFNYQIVEKFVSDFILPYFVDMTIYDNFAGQHPTTFLTQRMTDLGCTNWGYESEQIRTEEEYFIITGILIHSKVFAFGKGPSAKAARICASEAALERLNGDGFIEFQSICDCKIVGEKEMKDLETAKGSRANGEEEEVVWLEE